MTDFHVHNSSSHIFEDTSERNFRCPKNEADLQSKPCNDVDTTTLVAKTTDFQLPDGYAIFVENGQRILCPTDPDFQTKAYDDVKKYELFIDKLPHDLLEDELLPFLCRVGPVYQIRFMMNFSGYTKGNAFVIFEQPQDSFRAIEELNGEFIRINHPQVRIQFSVNNKRLHLKNIPIHYTDESLLSSKLDLPHVVKIKLFKPVNFDGRSLEAIVDFESHKVATKLRRLFVQGFKKLDGNTIRADWAKPKDFQTLFLQFQGYCDEKIIKNLFETDFSKITYVIFQGTNQVFIKYRNFQMANQIYKNYSCVNFPVSFANGLVIEKLDWPKRT